MGHYDGSNGKRALDPVDYQPSVFSQYKKHCAATRINTDLAVTEAIRASHPRCHVTSISTRGCDLIGYAKAGHGTAILQTEGDDFLGQRTYSPPRTRMENSPGKLGDKVTFGLFNANFDGKDIQFYVAEWEHEMYGIVRNTYLLTSKHEVDSAGHSKTCLLYTI